MSALRDEIRQSKPFDTPEQEAWLSILRTAACFEHAMTDFFRAYGITPTQYNVLRILRGAGSSGLCRNDVRDRMISRVPDATRLLDRMESLGLIERSRDSEDRRFVTARITDRGLELLEQLDEPVLELHRERLGGLDGEDVQVLIDLLDRIRTAE